MKKKLENPKITEERKKTILDLLKSFDNEEYDDDEEPITDVYIVASSNDWMPLKMKTKRRLAIEKISMKDPAPKNLMAIDNINLLFANFVAPGHHYFYFVQDTEKVFLSPKYDTVRFKNTNVFLNRITVRAKEH